MVHACAAPLKKYNEQESICTRCGGMSIWPEGVPDNIEDLRCEARADRTSDTPAHPQTGKISPAEARSMTEKALKGTLRPKDIALRLQR